jgi:hypothetical protein
MNGQRATVESSQRILNIVNKKIARREKRCATSNRQQQSKVAHAARLKQSLVAFR